MSEINQALKLVKIFQKNQIIPGFQSQNLFCLLKYTCHFIEIQLNGFPISMLSQDFNASIFNSILPVGIYRNSICGACKCADMMVVDSR